MHERSKFKHDPTQLIDDQQAVMLFGGARGGEEKSIKEIKYSSKVHRRIIKIFIPYFFDIFELKYQYFRPLTGINKL